MRGLQVSAGVGHKGLSRKSVIVRTRRGGIGPLFNAKIRPSAKVITREGDGGQKGLCKFTDFLNSP